MAKVRNSGCRTALFSRPVRSDRRVVDPARRRSPCRLAPIRTTTQSLCRQHCYCRYPREEKVALIPRLHKHLAAASCRMRTVRFKMCVGTGGHNYPDRNCTVGFIYFLFLMRLYRALRGCSCGSRGFRRGPDDGHNHRQGATSSTSRVTSLQGQSGARTAWAISVRSPRAETARC